MRLRFLANPFEAMGVCFDQGEGGAGAGTGEADPDKKQESGEGGKTYSEDYVKGIRQEAAKYRTKLKELEQRLGQLDGIDPEEYQRLKHEKEEIETKKLEAKGEFDAIKNKLLETHKSELTKRDEEIAKRELRISHLEGEINRTVLDNAITVEAAAAKPINAGALQMLSMRLTSEAKIEISEDGRRIIKLVGPDGSPMLNKQGNPMTIKERIEDMKQDENFAYLFEGGTFGAGSRQQGSGGKFVNPFAKDTFNLTAQGKLLKENPDLARRLAAEAGITLYSPE